MLRPGPVCPRETGRPAPEDQAAKSLRKWSTDAAGLRGKATLFPGQRPTSRGGEDAAAPRPLGGVPSLLVASLRHRKLQLLVTYEHDDVPRRETQERRHEPAKQDA